MNRISDSIVRLLARFPFYGSLAMNFKITETRKIRTAGVSPRLELYVNPDFISNLTDQQVDGLVVHEILHPALGIFERQGSRDQTLSNQAHDYVINLIIEDSGLKLPPDPLLKHEFRGLSYEEVYELLTNEEGKNGGEEGEEQGIGEDLDPFQEGGQMSSDEKKRLEKEMRQAVAGARQVAEREGWGSMPAGLRQIVDELIEPHLDWRQILSRWFGEKGRKDDYSYRRPSRRQSRSGLILPSLQGNTPDVAILIDTSGSMTGEPLTEVLSEIQSVVDDLRCATLVINCDAEVQGVLEDPDDINIILDKLGGGGGSDFRPAFNDLEDRGYQGIVVAATDGYIDVPNEQPMGIDTLWLIPKGGQSPAKWGDVVEVDL